MAFHYAFDSAANLLVIEGSGQVSMIDRYNCVNGIADDRSLPVKSSILINVSAVTNAPSAAEVKWIATLVQSLKMRFGGRVAICNAAIGNVTTSHFVAFSAQEVDEVRAFSCEIEAREWLGCCDGRLNLD